LEKQDWHSLYGASDQQDKYWFLQYQLDLEGCYTSDLRNLDRFCAMSYRMQGRYDNYV
jgi:hypothetical protein